MVNKERFPGLSKKTSRRKRRSQGSRRENAHEGTEDLLERTKDQLGNEAEDLKQQATETVSRKATEIVQNGANNLKVKSE